LTAGRRLHQLNLGLNLRKPGLTEFVGRAGTFIPRSGWTLLIAGHDTDGPDGPIGSQVVSRRGPM